MTRIGVLGSGQVGQTLAQGLKTHGYDVRIASRTPAKLADFSKKSGVATGMFAEVAAWAEALVLTVLGRAAENALREADPANLQGKLVIDTTNPIADGAPEDGVIRLFTSPSDSPMARLQAAVPGAHLAKAFYSVGLSLRVNPAFRGRSPTI